MKKEINLYIVDNSQQILDFLEEVFFEHKEAGIKIIGSSINHKNCLEDYQGVRKADVFLISAFLPDKMGIELIAHIKKTANPKAKCIVTVTGNTRNLVDEALVKGADDYIQKPFSPRLLVEKIYELLNLELPEDDEDMGVVNDRHQEEEDDEEVEIFRIEEEEEEEEREEPKSNKKEREVLDMFGGSTGGRNIFQNTKTNGDKPNKVCVFTAPKSVGKTTLLVNVAASVKRNSDYEPKIILVDLNLVYPSITFKMHQDDLVFAKKNIYDLMEDMDDLDRGMLERAVIKHEPTGIHILDTPFESIRDFNKVTADKVRQLILFLREEYDLVLIDTSGNVRDDATIVPMTLADTNIVLFESDLASLLHTRKFVEMIQMVEKRMDKKIIEKSLFVLNRFNPNSNLSLELVKSSIFEMDGIDLNFPLYIPEEQMMSKYSNMGQFVVDKPGDTTNKINELAAMIYPLYSIDGPKDKGEGKKGGGKSLFETLRNKLKK